MTQDLLPMVSINKLAFGYKRRPLLFSSLDMDLKKGALYGLFGRNGAGKTTLLKLIAGLLFPANGECLINGRRSGLRLPQALNEFYMVPEEFDLPPVTVRTYTGLHAPFYTRFDHEMMEHYLRELDIDPERSLHHLSYGQKKKYLIAFGLASRVSLLLLDEPTNGLDIPSKSQFRRIMAETASEDRCILISTHQVRDLGNIIDHITILEDGRIVFDESSGIIADRLSFRKAAGQEAGQEAGQVDKADILYSEEIFGGWQIITRRKTDESATEIDLELLFNAVIDRPDIISHVCKQGGDHE